ncbi:hypothetical protein Tco_0858715 [Tanacetum coccineum]|uniref:Uncharacterized protein n=1 Tax=Tanacetum coccineum TaxID=301880 RepID=A0ABQ5BDX8_9ASTR
MNCEKGKYTTDVWETQLLLSYVKVDFFPSPKSLHFLWHPRLEPFVSSIVAYYVAYVAVESCRGFENLRVELYCERDASRAGLLETRRKVAQGRKTRIKSIRSGRMVEESMDSLVDSRWLDIQVTTDREEEKSTSQPQSDQQSFHLLDETKDEDEPVPTPTSKKNKRHSFEAKGEEKQRKENTSRNETSLKFVKPRRGVAFGRKFHSNR